jgi:putative transposase
MVDYCTLQDLRAATDLPKNELKRLARGAEAKVPLSSGKRGRPAKCYLVPGLSDDLKDQLVAWRTGENHPCHVSPPQADPLRLNESEMSLCVAKACLIEEYRRSAARSSRGNTLSSKKEFIKLYNLGEHGSYPTLYKKIGSISFQSIERWTLKLDARSDPFALADTRGGHRKGQTSISPEQKSILISTILTPNSPNIAQAIRLARARMKAQNIPAPQHDKTFWNFYGDFREKHYDQWVFFREGEKARKEACEPSIIRDWGSIEVGDILFADGHTFNLESLDPETGRMKRHHLIQFYDAKSNFPLGYEISSSENTQSIAIALRRAILRLGKMPKVVYLDNSKAFRSRFFSGTADFRQEPFIGAFKQLGIHSIFANPYNARAKTLERLHQTMDEFERRCWSFIGSSIADKPPHLRRAEKFHKAWHDHHVRGRLLTNEELYWAYTKWLYEEYGQRPQRGHLNGLAPLDILLPGLGPGFSPEEEARLHILLAAKEVRRIGRDGIRLAGDDNRYYHPDLYGRQLQSATVRYDWLDKSKIYVYDSSGIFLCVAEPRKRIHPAAACLGSDKNVDDLKSEIGLQRSLAKQTLGPAREFYEKNILPELRFQQTDLGLEGIQPTPSDKSKPEQIEFVPIDIPAEPEEVVLAGVAELEELNSNRNVPPWEKARDLGDLDRYETLTELQARGIELPSQELAWLALFERSDSYRKHRNYFEQHQVKMALRYGQGA